MWVAYLDEGHSYEELLGLHEEAGGQGSNSPRPAFVTSTPVASPPSFPVDNQTRYTQLLDPGSHAFVVGGGYKYCQLGEGNAFLRFPPGCELRI